jgi:hypothetical protein
MENPWRCSINSAQLALLARVIENFGEYRDISLALDYGAEAMSPKRLLRRSINFQQKHAREMFRVSRMRKSDSRDGINASLYEWIIPPARKVRIVCINAHHLLPDTEVHVFT